MAIWYLSRAAGEREWFLPRAETWKRKYAALFGHPRPSLSPQTLQILLHHSWPGNIRQLENAVKKIIALGEEPLVVADWGPSVVEQPSTSGPAEGLPLKQAARLASRKAERELILKALARTRWNR